MSYYNFLLKEPNINISKGMILTKMPESSKDDTINLDDEMATNDINEEITPQPTKGRGVSFICSIIKKVIKLYSWIYF